MALPLASWDSEIAVKGRLESSAYVELTEAVLQEAGIVFRKSGHVWSIPGSQRYRIAGGREVEGDWSQAAFFMSAAAIGSDIKIKGLDFASLQGDMAALDVFAAFGANISIENDVLHIRRGELRGIEVNARDIPDMVPAIAVTAAFAKGQTVIHSAERLRLKESDRIESVCRTLSALGADIKETEDGMIIRGQKTLCGGEVDSFNDHRIAMSAAIASLVCKNAVKITRFEAINKSYPTFGENFIDNQR
jgi:3-phosphoshikimate 1-carboxyvinyltransferase